MGDVRCRGAVGRAKEANWRGADLAEGAGLANLGQQVSTTTCFFVVMLFTYVWRTYFYMCTRNNPSQGEKYNKLTETPQRE